MKAFAVVIPHCGPDALAECLERLEDFSPWISRVHVVDNNEENRGLTAACNVGLLAEVQAPSSERLLLVKNDCGPLTDPLEPLARRLASGDRIGIAAPRAVRPEDHDRIVWGGSVRIPALRLESWVR